MKCKADVQNSLKPDQQRNALDLAIGSELVNTMVNQGEDGQASKSATVGLRLMYYICTCVLYIQTSSMLHVTGPLKSKGSVRGGIAIEGENCAVSYGSHSQYSCTE